MNSQHTTISGGGRVFPLILMHTRALMAYLLGSYIPCKKTHKVWYFNTPYQYLYFFARTIRKYLILIILHFPPYISVPKPFSIFFLHRIWFLTPQFFPFFFLFGFVSNIFFMKDISLLTIMNYEVHVWG